MQGMLYNAGKAVSDMYSLNQIPPTPSRSSASVSMPELQSKGGESMGSGVINPSKNEISQKEKEEQSQTHSIREEEPQPNVYDWAAPDGGDESNNQNKADYKH